MVQYQEAIVAVMGVTGCGKSSFVNLLLGEQKAVVGHSLQARESQVQSHGTPTNL
jgi:predicted GTPase